jgi:hypothetical protein
MINNICMVLESLQSGPAFRRTCRGIRIGVKALLL